MKESTRTLTPNLEEIAYQELNEDPERRDQDVAYIKKWLLKQPHLKTRTDDQWILTFLRGCKFSLERTKEKLDTYYTMRTLLPEFFTNRDPMLPEIQEVLKTGNLLVLPTLDKQGRIVLLLRIGVADPNKVKLLTIMKLNFMIMDMILHESDNAIICGSVGMIDFKQMNMALMSQISPSLAKKMIKTLQDGYPMRPRGYNFVNLPSTYETIFSIVKSFLKDKLKKWLQVHDGMESLYKQIPKEILPVEYGGDAGTVEQLAADLKSKVESYRDWFLADEMNKSDEKKRSGKPHTQRDLFGIDGSFRQLALD